MEPQSGACFISLPQDVLSEVTSVEVIPPLDKISYGATHQNIIMDVAHLINHAKFPVLLLGQEASRSENAKAIRQLLSKTFLPTVGTFQAAGVVSRKLVSCFAGRVGLFRNQPGDQLLNKADVVLVVGFNPVEYDPEVWNAEKIKLLFIWIINLPIFATPTNQNMKCWVTLM